MSMRFDAIASQEGRLRELTEDDLHDLQALLERCADYYELHEGRPPTPTEAQDEWDGVPDGTPRDHKHIVGLFAPDLAGIVEVIRDWPRPGTWNIGLLLFDPAARRGGLGTRMMAAVDALADRAGADTLRITVIPANAGGMAFWRRQGFEPVPNVGVHPTAIAFERPVAGSD